MHSLGTGQRLEVEPSCMDHLVQKLREFPGLLPRSEFFSKVPTPRARFSIVFLFVCFGCCFNFFYISLSLCSCLPLPHCVCVCAHSRVIAHALAQMWLLKENLQKQVSSFCCVGFRDQIQVLRLDGRCAYLPAEPSGQPTCPASQLLSKCGCSLKQ